MGHDGVSRQSYYNPPANNINFPAGVQPSFYSPKADDGLNYGAIGVVVGHELTHGFDQRSLHDRNRVVNAGTIGLIQAVDRFQPSRGLRFGTYAKHRICGAMLDFLRGEDPLSRTDRRRVRAAETSGLPTKRLRSRQSAWKSFRRMNRKGFTLTRGPLVPFRRSGGPQQRTAVAFRDRESRSFVAFRTRLAEPRSRA